MVVVTVAFEVKGGGVVVKVVEIIDGENDGSCRSGEVVCCDEDNGKVDDVAVEKVVAVVVVIFKVVGSVIVMSTKFLLPLLLPEVVEYGVVAIKVVAVDPVTWWLVMLSISLDEVP